MEIKDIDNSSVRYDIFVASLVDGGTSLNYIHAIGSIFTGIKHALMVGQVRCVTLSVGRELMAFIFFTEECAKFASRIHHVYTFKKYRGRGLASMLIDGVLKHNVNVSLSVESRKLIGFYSCRGFLIWTKNNSDDGISIASAAKLMGLKKRDMQSGHTTEEATRMPFIDCAVPEWQKEQIVSLASQIYSELKGSNK